MSAAVVPISRPDPKTSQGTTRKPLSSTERRNVSCLASTRTSVGQGMLSGPPAMQARSTSRRKSSSTPAGCQNSAAGLAHAFDGGVADGRNIKAHVLLRFGDFDHDEAAGRAQFAGPEDGTVGAFDGLDGENGPLLDGDTLADIEPAHLFGQF